MSEKEPFKLKQASVRLVSSPPLHSSEPINSPEAAIRVMGSELKNYDREVLAVVNLKTNMEPINFSIVSMGALNASIAEPREMMKNMFLSNAYGVILVHNHPSGRLVPSQEDVKITDRMQQLCSLAGINLMDHVIIGAGNDRSYYSMREHGEISMNSIRFKERPEDLVWQDLKAAEPKSEYHQMELSELNGINSESKSFVPIYRHDAAYARVHGEWDQYMQSRKENVSCADAIEKAVSDNFDGAHLNADAAKSVVEQYGSERVAYVLANTVQLKDWDGRFSPGTKRWARSIETVPDIDGLGRDRREDFEVGSHPAVLDGFIDLARKEIDAKSSVLEMLQEKKEEAAKTAPSTKITRSKSDIEL